MSYNPNDPLYKSIPVIEEVVGYKYDEDKMKFKDYKKIEDKYNLSKGNDWMRLEEGDNKVRLISEFVDYGEHFDDELKKSFVCLGASTCPRCQDGDKPTVRFLGWVIDRKDNQIKLLRFGWMIHKQIGQLAADEESGFDGIPPYDMNIIRTGEKLKTDYNVVPSRKDLPLTEEELKEIDKLVKDPQEIIDSMKAKLEKEEAIDINDLPENAQEDEKESVIGDEDIAF